MTAQPAAGSDRDLSSKESKFLVVDGDANLLRGVVSGLRGMGQIRTAATTQDATVALGESKYYSVILAAINFPGATGTSMLRSMREQHPESVCLLMVGKEEVRSVSDAINESGAFRLLLKPFNWEGLRRAALEARTEYDRRVRDRVMLDVTLDGSLAAIAGMLGVVQPAAFGRATRLRRLSTLVAEKIGLPDIWDIQIAALLSQFGMVWLPSQLVDRLCRNQSITAAEQAQVTTATESMLSLFQPIPRMARVCDILRSVDFTPSRDVSRQPHKGDAERVLSLVLDFDGLFAEHGSAAEALRVMESHIGYYHTPYFDVFREIVGSRNAAILIDLPLAEVKAGQFFAADVRSPNDMLLVARGQPVTAPLLYKIRTDWNGFAARTMVRVVDPPDKSKEVKAES